MTVGIAFFCKCARTQLKMDAISKAYCSSDDEEGSGEGSEEQHSRCKLFQHTKIPHVDQAPLPSASSVRDSNTSFNVSGYVPKRKKLPKLANDLKMPSSEDYSHLKEYLDSDANIYRDVFVHKCGLPRKAVFSGRYHTKPILSAHFHPQNSCPLLLTSSLDGKLCIWDWYSRKGCVGLLHPHLQPHDPSSPDIAGINDAYWLDETTIISGGFDKRAVVVDAVTTRRISTFSHDSFVSALAPSPHDPKVFVAGDYNKNIKCWDIRIGDKPVSTYVGAGGRILDVEFLNNGKEIIASSDVVRRNASGQAIVVWESSSGTVFSNQVYQEPYTCPTLRPHPTDPTFLAQSNANYVVLFSSKRPYKMNKYKRFEGHRVEGYPVQCDVSPDGRVVASGDSSGDICYYQHHSGELIDRVSLAQDDPCVTVTFGQRDVGCIACCTWNGEMFVLR